MTTKDDSPTVSEMVSLFHVEFPSIRHEVREVTARAIATHYPKQAAFIRMVIGEDRLEPGRIEALNVLKRGMIVSGDRDTKGDRVPDRRFGAAMIRGRLNDTATPSQVYATAVHDWTVETKDSFFREFLWEWGMTKAVDELHLISKDFAYFVGSVSNYRSGLQFQVTGDKDGFMDESYSRHYYRAIAIIGVLGGHFEAADTLKFIQWLEDNDIDLKHVLNVSKAIFETPQYVQAINPERLVPLLNGEESLPLLGGTL